MSEESVVFLPYAEAKKIVANVIEEEHLREANRRILTVYDAVEKELCWFDAEDVLEKVGGGQEVAKTDVAKEEAKIAAVDYVMHHIPAWVLES